MGVLTLIGIGVFIRTLPNIDGDMFSYSGAIIGGGLTLLGVIVTLKYQEETRIKDLIRRDNERKEELALLYKPILVFEKSALIHIPEELSMPNLPHDISQFFLSFKNVGRGEALNIRPFGDVNCEITQGDFTDPGVLPISDTLTFVVNIPLKDLGMERMLDFNIEIQFEDARGNAYSYKFLFGFTYFINPCLRYFKMCSTS